MVFNGGDFTFLTLTMSTDKEQIEQLGDSTVVAKMLGYSVQRVQNWKSRGIPPKVKLERPDLFPMRAPDRRQLEPASN